MKACHACQVNQKSPSVVPLHPWEFPPRPWSHLHIDFARPFLGKQFIVLVDTYSKWLEVAVVSSCSTQQAVRFLRHVFSTHGIPDRLVSETVPLSLRRSLRSSLNAMASITVLLLMVWQKEQFKLLKKTSKRRVVIWRPDCPDFCSITELHRTRPWGYHQQSCC